MKNNNTAKFRSASRIQYDITPCELPYIAFLIPEVTNFGFTVKL